VEDLAQLFGLSLLLPARITGDQGLSAKTIGPLTAVSTTPATPRELSSGRNRPARPNQNIKTVLAGPARQQRPAGSIWSTKAPVLALDLQRVQPHQSASSAGHQHRDLLCG